jgi:uncharacterized phage-associated protein
MAKVQDVAAYIISKLRTVDAMKLQKLVYYSQAWSLVWDAKPLFRDKVEAWANGPVVRGLFKTYQGQYKISRSLAGDKNALTRTEQETVDAVLRFYGDKDAFYLSELTHRERPWMEARRGIAPGDKSDREITKASMRDYYGGLVALA